MASHSGWISPSGESTSSSLDREENAGDPAETVGAGVLAEAEAAA
eukprot:CAMPEP_0173186834 /NCGR_PEP_ID=MMETSP1141-20130122/10359_1 /TAXON_ID=483371 /ORGANISM="non described non described, Strain CCMP2298" /LENGTH=44 /DNA_ID= /DNA_START= /DNA_END= /DNA_ORIENTATION=